MQHWHQQVLTPRRVRFLRLVQFSPRHRHHLPIARHHPRCWHPVQLTYREREPLLLLIISIQAFYPQPHCRLPGGQRLAKDWSFPQVRRLERDDITLTHILS